MKQADAKSRVPETGQERARTRRTYALQFKRDVVAQCLKPRASVSAIALSHGINANVIRKWLPRCASTASTALATMLPVNIESAAVTVAPRPRVSSTKAQSRPPIELILNDATVRVPAGFNPAELHSIVQILAALR